MSSHQTHDTHLCNGVKSPTALLLMQQRANMKPAIQGATYPDIAVYCQSNCTWKLFPSQRPAKRSFDYFFDLPPNKWLNK